MAVSGSCLVCRESIEKPTKTRCCHWYCYDCISTCIDSAGSGGAQCPMCNSVVKAAGITQYRTPSGKEIERATQIACPDDESADSVRKAKRRKQKAAKQKAAEKKRANKGKGKKKKGKQKGGKKGGWDSDEDEDDSDEDDSDVEEVVPIEVPVLTAEQLEDIRKGAKTVLRSKLNVLLKELRALHAQDDGEGPPAKALIFSNFSSTIEWLKEQLQREGLQFRTLDGGMSMKQRAKALADFQNDPPTTVFLISIRAGAVGINLTQATHVFIMDAGKEAPLLHHMSCYRLLTRMPLSFVSPPPLLDSDEPRARGTGRRPSAPHGPEAGGVREAPGDEGQRGGADHEALHAQDEGRGSPRRPRQRRRWG